MPEGSVNNREYV